MTYRGRRRARWGEPLLLAAAGLLALVGLIFLLARPLGMRFSGFLLVALAAVLALELYLSRWAKVERRGWWCQLAFRAVLALVLVPLALIEGVVIADGRQAPPGAKADAVMILGAGVNGAEPSLSLRTRLDAALKYLEENPDIPVVLTGGQGYGEEITEARCMYDYLTARGVDSGRLILEEQASNTAENFAFSRELLVERGVDPSHDQVAVVTNDFHIARAMLIAARRGYGCAFGVPAELPWAHLRVNYYLREAFAMVKTFFLD
nr:YdcF family protein [uncultured Oscillibacter sp.]